MGVLLDISLAVKNLDQHTVHSISDIAYQNLHGLCLSKVRVIAQTMCWLSSTQANMDELAATN